MMVSSPIWAPVCPICNHCPVFLPWTLPFYMVLDGLDSVLPHSLLNFFSQVPSSESPFSPFAIPRNMGSEARGNMSTPSPVHVCTGNMSTLLLPRILMTVLCSVSSALSWGQRYWRAGETIERCILQVSYFWAQAGMHCVLDTIMMVDSSHM